MFHTLDKPLQFAWILLGAAWAGLVYELFLLWGVSPDYSDRYIIFVGSAWLVWRNVPAFERLPKVPSSWGFLGLLPALLVLPPAWFMMPQIHLNSTLILAITLATCLATLSLAVVTWGWRPARLLLFPVLFILFALPIPGQPYVILRGHLQELSTTLATKALGACGYAVSRDGFEIHMPSGPLEVVEACSGIRSMTALTAIAAFIAYYRGFGIPRGLGLFACSIPAVALCNAGRIAATGIIQENFGPAAIQGVYHDILGGLVVLVGLGIIVLISNLFVGRPAAEPSEAAARPVPAPAGGRRGLVACAVVFAAVAASAGLFAKGASRLSVREEERALENFALALGEPGRATGSWQGRDVPVNPEIVEALGCTKILCRAYENEIGRSVQVWTMYWPAHSLVLRGHHPEACLPRRGYVSVAKQDLQFDWKGAGQIALTEQLFRRETRDQLLHYWTQDGRQFRRSEDEFKDFSLSMPAWLLKRAQDDSQQDRIPRLGVLIGTDSTGQTDAARRTLAGFTRLYAAELYRLCPWAEPGRNDE